MNVVIDHREPDRFLNLFDEEDTVLTAQLECGDFLVNEQWLFERKTIRDLCVSLADGRLFKQALRLVQSEYHPVVILEGSSRDIKDFKIRREAVQGALITLSIFFGLPVLRSLDSEETVQLIRYTVEQGGAFRRRRCTTGRLSTEGQKSPATLCVAEFAEYRESLEPRPC